MRVVRDGNLVQSGSPAFDAIERILQRTAERDVGFSSADRFTYELG